MTLTDNPADQSRLRREALQGIIDRAAALLPIPGPITAFAFLNTLQAFEDLPFDEGMRRGARLYAAQPYLPEERYRASLARGRIRPEDILAALLDDLGDSADTLVGSLGTRFELRMTMLLNALPMGPDEELQWFIVERDALSYFHKEVPRTVRERFVEETRRWVLRDLRASGGATDQVRTRELLADLIPKFSPSSIEHWNDPVREWEALSLQVLWRVCCDGALRTAVTAAVEPRRPVRHRDLLREATGTDSDWLVHETLIKICAAFTDQGFAPWPLPDRERGFFPAFSALYRRPKGPPDRWLRGLPAELSRVAEARLNPIDSILESLDLLGVAWGEWEDFLTATLLALRGWAGMLWQMDVRRDRVPSPVPPGTLIEFLAVRLILDRLATAYVARETLDYTGPLCSLRDFVVRQLPAPRSTSVEQRALLIFELAQLRVWTPPELFRLSDHEWRILVAEIEAVDAITYYDLDFLPKSHFHDFEAAVKSLEEACERNAHERCRRFDSAPVDLSFEAAHQHVEGRSEDLAQTRPEFGNATNAFCFVGRRARTRGLYLDRRCFMASYDPTQDDAETAILARILSAVVPVCEGINMQYYLSSVDSPGWACGTKLPHNVSSLLGVMDGAGSDLRPGLPWQGVEIHEPVRVTFIIETTPGAMLQIMQRNPTINRILANGWGLLAVLDPNSNEIQVFKKGEFCEHHLESSSLPTAASSTDWYRGWRDHLGFAVIDNNPSTTNSSSGGGFAC